MIFAEQAPGLAERYQRRSALLTWHLLHNLTKAVDRVVGAHRKCLHDTNTDEQAAPTPPPAAEPMPGLREQTTRERHAEIHALLGEGLGIKAISRTLNLARETVRRYARAEQPEHLLSELRARGYRDAVRTVRKLVQDWRITDPPPTSTINTPPKPRDVTGWIMRPAAKVPDEEKKQLQRILDRCNVLRQVDQLVSDFAGMARERQGRHLDTWITGAQTSGIASLASFADGLIKDYDAVRNGLTLDWSSGAVEGHVNRIKTIKRQMYGRANFDLLRQRVLAG